MKRQLPKRHDLAPLLKFKKPTLSPKERRLAVGADDRGPARGSPSGVRPRPAFDYTDGAADGEVSLARARQAFADVEFHPAILRDVSTVDTSREVLGKRVALPFGIAPTGFTRMMQAEGEIAGRHRRRRRRASRSRCRRWAPPRSRTSRRRNPDGRNWFQLYMWKDRDRSMALVDRAAKAGLRHAAGHRRRAGRRRPAARRTQRHDDPADPDARGPWSNAIPRPAWWINFLTTEPLAFASLDAWSGTVAELLDTMFDPTVTYDDLAWIRDQWPGKVVVKGVQTVDDARRLADAGVDAILLSNHGGRQLDRAPIPFHLLPDVVKAVGSDVEVHLDTGIMSGQDIVAAIAHGARLHAGRPRLPLRADGRRPRGRRPDDRDPARPDRADHAAARRTHPRRARARARHPAGPAGAPVALTP